MSKTAAISLGPTAELIKLRREVGVFCVKGPLIRVLIIDDSEADALGVIATLRRGGFTPYFQRVDTTDSLSDALKSSSWDVVLSTEALKELSAHAALQVVRQVDDSMPFVVITNVDDSNQDRAVMLMQLGVDDYVSTDESGLLPVVVKRQLKVSRLQRELKQKDEQLDELQNGREAKMTKVLEEVSHLLPKLSVSETAAQSWISIVSKNWLPILLSILIVLLTVALLYATNHPVPLPFGKE
jgi:response regulator RpfG family c-di-GMP phosphodiesterase